LRGFHAANTVRDTILMPTAEPSSIASQLHLDPDRFRDAFDRGGVLRRYRTWWTGKVPFLLGILAVIWIPAAVAAPSEVRSTAVTPAAGGRAGFTRLDPAATGLVFTNLLAGDAYLTNAVAHNGSGVAIGDVDGDGRPDIYLCSLQGTNQLFRNLGGWKFAPMEIGAAVCAGQMSTGAVFADIDGDGDLDLLVNGIAAGTRLFLNDGHGHWTEKTGSGLSRSASGTSMALADMDGDGDLDLYVAHYIDFMHLVDPTTRFAMGQRDGRWVVSKVNDVPTTDPRYQGRFEVMPDGEVRENPEADALYRNDGDGRFTAVQGEPGVFSDAAGRPMPAPRDYGLAVVFRDLDGDGFPDLYVSNDYASPDRMWINDGHGRFRAADPLKLRHTSFNSMGIDVADVDRDGLDDILVVDLLAPQHERRMRQLAKTPPDPRERDAIAGLPQYNRNMLFMGRPGADFAETALMAGIAATGWSWTPVFLDVDLDGYEDLLVTSGFGFDLMDQDTHDRRQDPRRRRTRDELKRWMKDFPDWRSESLAFRNRGDGTFGPVVGNWGFGDKGLAFGMALGDLDGDGDLDVVVSHMNAPAALYRNDTSAGRIGVRLRGTTPNTAGVGARIRLTGPSITQSQEMVAGGRYLSGDQSMRVFATDLSRTNALAIEVRWRNGAISRITDVVPDHIYEIGEAGTVAPAPAAPPPAAAPMFRDVSDWLDHAGVGEPFDDAGLQPLLPRRLSRSGPGVAWTDLDGDGWEDLVIGAPRGGRPTIFSNQQGKSFKPARADAVPGGERGVVGWADAHAGRKWLGAASDARPGQRSTGRLAVHGDGQSAPRYLDGGDDPIGPLAVGDIDGDGDLDVFAGGQSRPGRYPESGSSAIWTDDGGTLRRSAEASRPFASAGLVSGATLVDLDGDGDLDLALAVEWGPVRIFRNDGGHFEEVTLSMGLADRTGGWTGIVAGDLDGDGRMDLAVGNSGNNTGYALLGPGPIRIYHGAWSVPDRVEILEAWRRDGTWLPIKNRNLLAAGLPDLPARFPTHEAFGKATVAEILGDNAAKARYLESNESASGILLNRGSRFEWHPLPREAQLAPVFSVNVGDVDGDGIEDLFLSQNRSDLLPELSRDDAGRGLWLRGRGAGTFAALDAGLTGIAVHGEQRAAAIADLDHDGRIDLVVTQFDGPTRLFLNQRARPGLRVVLEGPTSNPDGIGAQVRMQFQDGHEGPVRAVQGGSGYGSQDSAAAVLGVPTAPKAVWVRWPGGKIQIEPVAAGQAEVKIRSEKR